MPGQAVSFTGTVRYSAEKPAIEAFCVNDANNTCTSAGGQCGSTGGESPVAAMPGSSTTQWTHTFTAPGTYTVMFYAYTHCQYWYGGATTQITIVVAGPTGSPAPTAKQTRPVR